MLVISRKTEEYVRIGEDIIVKVIKSSNGTVKIGIEAPGALRVLRGELETEGGPLPKSLPRNRRTRPVESGERDACAKAEAL